MRQVTILSQTTSGGSEIVVNGQAVSLRHGQKLCVEFDVQGNAVYKVFPGVLIPTWETVTPVEATASPGRVRYRAEGVVPTEGPGRTNEGVADGIDTVELDRMNRERWEDHPTVL